MPCVIDCEITRHDCVAPDHFRMRLRAAPIARTARAGQFGMFQVAGGYAPFLRRPMSFERIHEDGISILYKVEGEGTALLSRMTPGQTVSVQGPLGNGFPIDTSYQRHIIVAGGIGVAPFPALADVLARACGQAPEVVVAARTRAYLLCVEAFEAIGCEVHLATDDGSAGEKAWASEMLRKLEPGPGTRVYACGPMAMMRATSAVAVEAGADCQVSLEAQMACGDGACLGCVVESKREKEGESMVRVCKDGPVFDTRIIDWEAHDLAYDR